VDGRRGAHRMCRSIVKREQTHIRVIEFDILAGFKVEETAYRTGSDGDALVRPVTLLQTLRDLPLHSVAHAFVVPLLHTRQQQQSHQKQSCTHQLNQRHTAAALQTLRNHTTASISQLVRLLHHMPLHAPPSPVSTTTPRHVFNRSATPPLYPSSPPLTHAPAYQVDRFQALEPPQVGAQRCNVVVRHQRI
jgi:hypothetical protein